ncbi:MAG TPA: indole-3-glycerol phosphate synthase TrpC [Thermoanaerobaculia bacterium]|nr:indole-3-glycerol phosphate synthase TrpC [Thermoanaerobaculia bacterium]
MSDILRQIVDQTREELRRIPLDLKEWQQSARARVEGRDRHRFAVALQDRRIPVRIIAEIKAASPSAGTIVADPPVEEIARAYRDGGAAAISVVTEPVYFHGSRDWIEIASRASGLPVLMKDFIIEPAQIYRGFAAGADAILLLAAILGEETLAEFLAIVSELGGDALVEVHDEKELERALNAGANIIGVNNRDLRTFTVDLESSERLVRRIPDTLLRVAESGIDGAAEVQRLRQAGFGAFLVGESLLRQSDRTAAVRALMEVGA